MQNKLLTKTTISINASPKQVWHALTTPALIKKYLMGTDVATTWQEGSPINYTGEYQGKKYHEKGVIKKVNPQHLLQSTYLSSDKEDKPKNYKLVTYTLKKANHKTLLTLTQDNNADEEEKEHSTQNWKAVLKKLKTVVETEVHEAQLLA
ncbi:MAG TPA: SRPBCC family protein [Bacteroidia bacterium]|nr:SRPBCC family protein [Bacteroidia bacterium]